MARSMLGHNLEAINDDGTITPIGAESPQRHDAGHAALAIGEFYRATNETTLGDFDLVDLAARCITSQTFGAGGEEEPDGLAYAALGLLSFGPAVDRNEVWVRLVEQTQERLAQELNVVVEGDGHLQGFEIAKAVTGFSLGLTKKDETGALIDGFIDKIGANSTAGFTDDRPGKGIGGTFDLSGVATFVFIRQALQLHANVHLRERKLPSLRTFGEKYIKMMPDIVRQDGMGWIYGRGIGAYGQMHAISIILQGMRDGWITDDQRGHYNDILRRLFQFFFFTYLEQENGTLVIRDEQRATLPAHTTRVANFDGARYLSQWARLARSIGGTMDPKPVLAKTSGRFVIFDKTNRKEQGLFIYQDTDSGLHVQLPLVSGGGEPASDSLAFPHCPGIFDWPANRYLPILVPELTFGEDRVVPCFYGKRCVYGLGLRKSFYFRYEQPELVTHDERVLNGIGSAKVAWTFAGNKVTSDFIFSVKNQVQMDRMRYCLVIGAPHETHRIGSTFQLGEAGLRCNVTKDDFQAVWEDTEVVTNETEYKTYYGNIHYVQTLSRDHPLIMRPGQQYRLSVSFEPDITFAE